jgi:hypothetical protein
VGKGHGKTKERKIVIPSLVDSPNYVTGEYPYGQVDFLLDTRPL